VVGQAESGCVDHMDTDNSGRSDLEQAAVPAGATSAATSLSPAARKSRRLLTVGLSVVGVVLIGTIVLLVFLSVDAYRAAYNATAPSPGQVVVGVLRDAAIIFVAFETMVIGILLIVFMIQMQSMLSLLREEIKPLLEAANETASTVRGTTQFVSHNVVSPVMKWSGYVAGAQHVLKEITGLIKKNP